MPYQLVFLTPTGDAIVLLSATITPQLLPLMSMRVAELEHYIPGLRVVTLDHELTTLTFTRGDCALRGERIRWFTGIEEG